MRDFLVKILEIAKERYETMEAAPAELPGVISAVDHIPATFVLTSEDANDDSGLHIDSADTRQHSSQPSSQPDPSLDRMEPSIADEAFEKSDNDLRMSQPSPAPVGVSK